MEPHSHSLHSLAAVFSDSPHDHSCTQSIECVFTCLHALVVVHAGYTPELMLAMVNDVTYEHKRILNRFSGLHLVQKPATVNARDINSRSLLLLAVH